MIEYYKSPDYYLEKQYKYDFYEEEKRFIAHYLTECAETKYRDRYVEYMLACLHGTKPKPKSPPSQDLLSNPRAKPRCRVHLLMVDVPEPSLLDSRPARKGANRRLGLLVAEA